MAIPNDAIRDRKLSLRREMRAIRRGLDDREARSLRLWAHICELPAVAHADLVMVFSSVPGEPVTDTFIEWCRAHGKSVVLPESEPPPDPDHVDAVIVPGVAFTADGRRLGQGGGWYDRFLPRLRPGTPTIGVAFAPQLVDDIPTEPHDVVLDLVVTDAGVAGRPSWSGS